MFKISYEVDMFYFLLVNFLSYAVVTGQRPPTNNLPSVILPENDLKDNITQIFNECKCVIFYLCDEENFIIPQEQLKNTRVPSNYPLRNVKRLRCTNELYYCCQNRTTTSNKFTKRIAPVKTEQLSYVSRRTGLTCGQSESHNSPRIIDQFPWVVAIYHKKKYNFVFSCSGSVINPKIVVTIQQCVYSSTPGEIGVAVNQQMLKKTLSLSYPLKQASKIIKHENYNSRTRYNDVALIILNDPIESIPPICLSNHNFNEQRCVLVGWGKKKRSVVGLRKFDNLPITRSRLCTRLLKNAHLGNNFSLHSSFLCTGVRKYKIRNERRGGPLMCKEGDRYTLAGILSRVIAGRKKTVQNLYTNMGFLHNWVERIMSEN